VRCRADALLRPIMHAAASQHACATCLPVHNACNAAMTRAPHNSDCLTSSHTTSQQCHLKFERWQAVNATRSAGHAQLHQHQPVRMHSQALCCRKSRWLRQTTLSVASSKSLHQMITASLRWAPSVVFSQHAQCRIPTHAAIAHTQTQASIAIRYHTR
jgi:hypothetical protein